MNRPFNLIIAGGKTGGHLFPGIAVAQAVLRQRPDAQVRFVGTDAPFEIQTLERYGFDHRIISSRPVKGGSLLNKLISAGLVLVSLAQSIQIMTASRPDFVLGVGGFSSFSVVLAARLMGIPTAIQEQNTIPGLTNRMLAPFAGAIFTAFDQTRQFGNNPKTRFTGNPVRKPTRTTPDLTPDVNPEPDLILEPCCAPTDSHTQISPTRHPDAKPNPDRFTLLITGGSQGARSINLAVADALAELENDATPENSPWLPPGFTVIHQTGRADEAAIQDRYCALAMKTCAKAFFSNLPEIEKQADLIIARAGAGTLSELAMAGKPAILVPFPHAADDHQTMNARAFEQSGAAVLIHDRDLNGAVLKKTITRLIRDSEGRSRMGRAMKSLAMPDADEVIARHILDHKRRKA